jgi:hypothetical protein
MKQVLLKKYIAIPAAIAARNLNEAQIRALGYGLQDAGLEDIVEQSKTEEGEG